MSSRPRYRVAGSVSGVAMFSLLAGCGPIPVGLTAVSQRDGHLLIAVMRCDETALRHAAVTHRGPFESDAPRSTIDDGRWETDRDDNDVIIVDTSAPGDGWTTTKPLSQLQRTVRYTASAGGDDDEPMGSVGFTTAELDALAEGQWLYDDDADGADGADGVARPTATDLADLREKSCP